MARAAARAPVRRRVPAGAAFARPGGGTKRRLRGRKHRDAVSSLVEFAVADLVWAILVFAVPAAPFLLAASELSGFPQRVAVAVGFGLVMIPVAATAILQVWWVRYQLALRRRPNDRVTPDEIPVLLWRGSRAAYAGGLVAGAVIAVFYDV